MILSSYKLRVKGRARLRARAVDIAAVFGIDPDDAARENTAEIPHRIRKRRRHHVEGSIHLRVKVGRTVLDALDRIGFEAEERFAGPDLRPYAHLRRPAFSVDRGVRGNRYPVDRDGAIEPDRTVLVFIGKSYHCVSARARKN